MLTDFVYFAQAGDGGPIKIGTSRRVAHDLNRIQSEIPFTLNTLKVVDGGRTLESKLHKALSDYHIRSDWYEPSGPLMSLVSSFEDQSHKLGLTTIPVKVEDDQSVVKGRRRSLLDKVTPHVYVARVPDGPFRIGFSWTIENHLNVLQEAVPYKLDLITVLECVPSIVDEVCADLSEHRLHGQWFEPSLEVQLAVDTLPERVRGGMSAARFYGGRDIRSISSDDINLQAQWLHDDLDHVYRRAHAPFASVLHLKSGASVPRLHMTVVEAQDILREEISSNPDRVSGICLYQRPLHLNHADRITWAFSSTVGDCPGGCAGFL